jgi:hypothetical protein
MYEKQYRCTDCDGGILTGDGRCKYCHGSGTNLNLASDVPECAYCKGTGVCQGCDGTGLCPPQNDIDQKTIQTLFDN